MAPRCKTSSVTAKINLFLCKPRMDEERGVCRFLVGKPEGRKPLGIPRRRWVDNIRLDLQDVGCGYMDWNGLAQDRQVAEACDRGKETTGET